MTRITGAEAKRLREGAGAQWDELTFREDVEHGARALIAAAPSLALAVEELERERDEARAGEARVVRAVMGGADGDRMSAICRAEAMRNALDALRVAARELEWGDREMRGRPPDHWLSALETVRHALSHSALETP